MRDRELTTFSNITSSSKYGKDSRSSPKNSHVLVPVTQLHSTPQNRPNKACLYLEERMTRMESYLTCGSITSQQTNGKSLHRRILNQQLAVVTQQKYTETSLLSLEASTC